jgi:hypothetical protein
MYCPKCSQQQVSEAMRFCSRCGFPLDGVTELIASDGVLAATENESEGPRLSPRQKGVRKALLLLIPSFVLLVSAGLIHDKIFDKPSLGEAIILFGPGIMCLTVGLVRLLHALLLEESAPRVKEKISKSRANTVAQLRATRNNSALPPAQSAPASGWTQRLNTAEMVQVPSVTENTTKLLNNSADPGEHN